MSNKPYCACWHFYTIFIRFDLQSVAVRTHDYIFRGWVFGQKDSSVDLRLQITNSSTTKSRKAIISHYKGFGDKWSCTLVSRSLKMNLRMKMKSSLIKVPKTRKLSSSLHQFLFTGLWKNSVRKREWNQLYTFKAGDMTSRIKRMIFLNKEIQINLVWHLGCCRFKRLWMSQNLTNN